MNQAVSKVLIWFGLDDSTAINNSEKEDSPGFKRFDLFGEFLCFVTYGCQDNRKY